MITYDTTVLTVFLTVVLAVAAIGLLASLGTVAEAVVRNRRTRLTRQETLRGYYGSRLALHH